MTALSISGKEIASAMPLPPIVVDCMIIVLPPEIQAELGKGHTVSFFSIALGFFNLTNQARLHKSPFKDKEHHATSWCS